MMKTMRVDGQIWRGVQMQASIDATSGRPRRALEDTTPFFPLTYTLPCAGADAITAPARR